MSKSKKGSKKDEGSKLPEHLEESHNKMTIGYLNPSNVSF